MNDDQIEHPANLAEVIHSEASTNMPSGLVQITEDPQYSNVMHSNLSQKEGIGGN